MLQVKRAGGMCGIHCVLGGAAGLDAASLRRLRRRGPDAHTDGEIILPCGACVGYVSCVLGMRGPRPTPQPLTAPSGDRLLYNGNVWGGIQVNPDENDGEVLLCRLETCESDEDIAMTFAQIQGPFAFVFVQASANYVWFGRDMLGRRSLLWAKSQLGLHLSSVAVEYDEALGCRWSELPSGALFRFSLASPSSLSFCRLRRRLEEPLLEALMDAFPADEIRFPRLLPSSLLSPTFALPSPSDLAVFSGLDSLAPSEALDRLSAHFGREKRGFKAAALGAVRRRLAGLVFQAGEKGEQGDWRAGDSIGILFSGGVDSLFLAALAHLGLECSGTGIDLLNVAFETGKGTPYEVPDRVLGRAAVAKLRELYPTRRWNFVEVNVSREELSTARSAQVRHLLLPQVSVLDDSIGCALWFAARGESRSRLLLVGSGADELLGGYARHRARFARDGWEGLAEELNLELHRLSSRNLGRDDRVISDAGRESRLPFLDEEFLAALDSLPLWARTHPGLPRGLGEKFLLRLCLWELGLGDLALSPKRALQFGSRIAKAENRKEKAGDLCERLLS